MKKIILIGKVTRSESGKILIDFKGRFLGYDIREVDLKTQDSEKKTVQNGHNFTVGEFYLFRISIEEIKNKKIYGEVLQYKEL